MTYTLYGSRTSPFVRKVRMLMEDLPYDFKELDIFSPEGAKILNEVNPINQLPALVDGDQKIWDSRQIYNYLCFKHELPKMTWDEENILTAIDSAASSGVTILLMRRSGLPEDVMYSKRQHERISSVLDYLKPYILDNALKEWSFNTMSLYSFLDWAIFRNIFSIEDRPECQKFLDAHAERQIVKETQIPKA